MFDPPKVWTAYIRDSVTELACFDTGRGVTVLKGYVFRVQETKSSTATMKLAQDNA